jgi:hypothetical protein
MVGRYQCRQLIVLFWSVVIMSGQLTPFSFAFLTASTSIYQGQTTRSLHEMDSRVAIPFLSSHLNSARKSLHIEVGQNRQHCSLRNMRRRQPALWGLSSPNDNENEKENMNDSRNSSSSSKSIPGSDSNNNNMFDSFFNQFWNSIGMSPSPSPSTLNSNSSTLMQTNFQLTTDTCEYDDDDDDEDSLTAGTYSVVRIPVKEMKPGGLRLFLMFYLMGMQNTPHRNTWRANQPDKKKLTAAMTMSLLSGSNNNNVQQNKNNEEEEYIVDFRYVVDNSATLSIVLRRHSIRIYRIGSTPSNSYMIQESFIVQGILNELDQCATDDRIPMANRLLILRENNLDAITAAKDTLAFG